MYRPLGLCVTWSRTAHTPGGRWGSVSTQVCIGSLSPLNMPVRTAQSFMVGNQPKATRGLSSRSPALMESAKTTMGLISPIRFLALALCPLPPPYVGLSRSHAITIQRRDGLWIAEPALFSSVFLYARPRLGRVYVHARMQVCLRAVCTACF